MRDNFFDKDKTYSKETININLLLPTPTQEIEGKTTVINSSAYMFCPVCLSKNPYNNGSIPYDYEYIGNFLSQEPSNMTAKKIEK